MDADERGVEQLVAGHNKKCKQHKWKDKSHGDCSTTVATVGVQGGTITTGNGLTLDIPFGALDGDTTLTVTTTDLAPPADVGAVSPVYEFQPEGIVFATPITVTLPLPAGVTTGSVYWSKLNAPGFDELGGTIAGGTITTETVHFSLAVIGSPSGTRTVEGSAQDTWISSTSRNTLPSDLATGTLEAIVSDGAGGFVSKSGSYAGDGTFSIPSVPVGQYILHAYSTLSGHLMIVTDSNAPDLGRNIGGKPLSQRIPLTQTTPLSLTVTNLEAWEDGDSVELWSTQVDDWWFGAEVDQSPSPGSTSSTFELDMTRVYNGYSPAEIHGPGDTLTVAQLTKQVSSTGATYQAMAGFASAPPTFTLLDGVPTSATVALSPLTLGETLSVDFRGASYVQAIKDYGHPSAVTCPLCGGFVGVLAQAGYAEDGFYTANADLMLLYDDGAGHNILSGNLTYPAVSSLGGQWGALYVARWNRRNMAVLDGSVGPGLGAALFVGVQWVTTKAGIEAGPLTPKLTQVRDAAVNGIPFFSGAPSIGATTTVSWTVPAVGTPQFYRLTVHEYSLLPNQRTGGKEVATVMTPETSFTFPPNILDPAKTYAFTIAAVASTSSDPNRAAKRLNAPYKPSNESASASVSSAVFGNGYVITEGTPVQGGVHNPLGLAKNSSSMFWAEHVDELGVWPPPNTFSGRIWMANLDGSDPHVIATGQAGPLAVLATDTTVYWTNEGDYLNDSSLVAYDLATHTITTLVAEAGIEALARDAATGDLIFTSANGVEVLRGGVGPHELLAVGYAVDVATDGTNVYFTDYGESAPAATGRVLSVPLATALGPITELATNQPQAWGVETDGVYVYWTNQAWQQSFPATLNRVPVGGGPVMTLASGKQSLKAFTIDAAYAYFVTDTSVKRVPLLGGSVRSVAFAPSSCAEGILAFAGTIVWSDVCNGATYRARP